MNMKNIKSLFYYQGLWLSILLMVFIATRATAQEEKILVPDKIFFSAPLNNIDDKVKDEVAICLDLPFERIKYPLGFINALDTTNPPVPERGIQYVSDPSQKAKILKSTNVKIGDTFTLVTATGDTYATVVTSYAYVNITTSDIMVAAMARVEAQGDDSRLSSKPGLAIRGTVALDAEARIGLNPKMPVDPELREQLKKLCAESIPKDHVVVDYGIVTAWLEPLDPGSYFVSLWHRPEPEYDIEDIKISGCSYRTQDKQLSGIPLPLPVEIKAALDLDRDQRAELIAITGNGAEICHVLLSYDGSKFTVLKKGLCMGY